MKTFNVIKINTIGEITTFSFLRLECNTGKPLDQLNVRVDIIDEDKNGNFTFKVIDGWYSVMLSGKVFNIGETFKVEKTTHTNKIIINKQTFLRLDVGTTKINRYETVKIFIRGFISRLYLRMVSVFSKRSRE